MQRLFRMIGSAVLLVLLAVAGWPQSAQAQTDQGLQVVSYCNGKYVGTVDKALMAQIEAERGWPYMFGVELRPFLLFKGDVAADVALRQEFHYSRAKSPVHFLKIVYPFRGRWPNEDCFHAFYIGPDAVQRFSFGSVKDDVDWRLALSLPAQTHFQDLVALCATYKGKDYGIREFCSVGKVHPEPNPGEITMQDECIDLTFPNDPAQCIFGDFSPEIAAKSSVLRLRITSVGKRWLVTVVGDLVEVVPET